MASIRKPISVIRDLQVGQTSKACATDRSILHETSRYAKQHERKHPTRYFLVKSACGGAQLSSGTR